MSGRFSPLRDLPLPLHRFLPRSLHVPLRSAPLHAIFGKLRSVFRSAYAPLTCSGLVDDRLATMFAKYRLQVIFGATDPRNSCTVFATAKLLVITVCTVMQYCCKGRSKKYRKWHFSGCCCRETP